VHSEERVKDDIRGDDIGVKGNRHCLRVTGAAGADLLIGGVFDLAPGVSGDYRVHAPKDTVGGIETPETTTGEDVGFHVSRLILVG
jgi:hypothetical protein